MPNAMSDIVLATRQYLESYVKEKQVRAASISPYYGELWQSIYSQASATGKYIRPQLVILAAQATKRDISMDEMVPVAASVELLHLAMLVHDDIIDRDDVRKGIPNVTGRYLDSYETLVPDTSDRRHFASSAALLAGDALLSSSHHVLTRAKLPPGMLLRAVDMMDEATFRVIGGELMDTESSLHAEPVMDPLVTAVEKTSRYSFSLPLSLGATIGGAPEDVIRLLDEIGVEMGVVFQLRDDELGVFGDSGEIGKPVDSDIREGKWTFMAQKHLQLADDNLKTQFSLGFGRPEATIDEIEATRRALEASGARQASTERMRQSQARAQQMIDSLPWPESSRNYLSEVLEKCATRSA